MRKLATYIVLIATTLLSIISLSGCFGQTSALRNTSSYDVSQVTSIDLSYGVDGVSVYASDDETITVKEFMSKDDASYYANASLTGGSLSVSAGGRPSDDPYFTSYVEIYIPISYHGSITITTTSGNVSFRPSYQLDSLQITTEGGSITLNDITCPDISLVTQSGTIRSSSSTGHITCSSQTSSIDAQNISGYGSFTSDSGAVTTRFTYVSGDIDITDRSGKVTLAIPSKTNAVYSATTESGFIQTDFSSDTIDTRSDTEVTAHTGVAGISHNVMISTTSGAITTTLSK